MAQEAKGRTQSKNKNGKKTTAKGKTTTKRTATRKPTQKNTSRPRTTRPKVSSANDSEYLIMAQRLKAEFDNYKRRTETEMNTKFNDGKAYAITKILPVIDSFDQGLKQITDENVLSGVKMIYSQLDKALSDMGVVRIECVGQEFDPNYHNAVMACDVEESDGTVRVLEELQAGFTLDGKVIRHSVVKVSR